MSDDNADKLTRLEEEGELAADYLEELLDIADLDGDIEIDVENGRASVEIVADDPDALDRLVGEDGEVLDARRSCRTSRARLSPACEPAGMPSSSRR